jgi:hypothetical protein
MRTSGTGLATNVGRVCTVLGAVARREWLWRRPRSGRITAQRGLCSYSLLLCDGGRVNAEERMAALRALEFYKTPHSKFHIERDNFINNFSIHTSIKIAKEFTRMPD